MCISDNERFYIKANTHDTLELLLYTIIFFTQFTCLIDLSSCFEKKCLLSFRSYYTCHSILIVVIVFNKKKDNNLTD